MSDKMAEIIKHAAEASKHAPEHLQEAAFQKVFDALMAEAGDSSGASGKPARKKAAKKKALKVTKAGAEDDAPTLDDLNRTEHPEINHNGSGLDNSLRLIRAAREDLGIDGLTASEIARVLTDKFRARITKQAVSPLLNDAGQYVDRRRDGNKVIFRIMAPGEEYLDSGASESTTTPAAKRRKKMRSKKKTKKKAKKVRKKASKKKVRKTAKKNSTSKKTGGRSGGPAGLLGKLIENKFFDKPRTIANITKRLKDNHGHAFKASELSPALLRLLRSEKLSREKNSEGQYEYKKS